ncbi:hypothetical protein SEA_MABODAMACA_18 [Microbacterium phage Mabodamaca]|uniref:Uncharacterized protein n=1 Tax=Microbacterium phage Mabodamaca TaxID=3078574 RepID=A0AA96NAS8_9CAUD|nr:hypothetical protein SEA_MABODAMACA_18 [Microbacterium phage Mabodamaca]
MKPCFSCQELAVDVEEPARYDVLAPDINLMEPSTYGPYCAACWPSTVTGKAEAETPPITAAVAIA